LDYLLKPLDIEDLLGTLKRVREKNQSLANNTKQFQVFFENMKVAGPNPMRIAIPDATGFVFLELEKIIRVEGISNSSKLYLVDGKVYMVTRMIKEFEQLFGESFCRVHKKHLINLKHAVQYIKGDGGEIRMSDGYNVEVSRRKKQEVMNRIKQLH
jgi:two-component system LytT family response regulator